MSLKVIVQTSLLTLKQALAGYHLITHYIDRGTTPPIVMTVLSTTVITNKEWIDEMHTSIFIRFSLSPRLFPVYVNQIA
jgi:hypothetical protein